MANTPAKVTYHDGIAILQLIIFPFIAAAGIFIWSRAGWRIGSKIWRYPVTLSLIRIAGSISALLTIHNDSRQVEIAMVVCALIGIAPLLLTYVGMLRQIDVEERMPPRAINLLTLVALVGLIVGIAGVSSSNSVKANGITKAAMGIFLAVFVIEILATAWLYLWLRGNMRVFQKRLFLASALSFPFLLIRIVYSAIGDYGNNNDFSVYGGNPTIYLCMSVLEEIVAMGITMVLGMAAVRSHDFVKYDPAHTDADAKYGGA